VTILLLRVDADGYDSAQDVLNVPRPRIGEIRAGDPVRLELHAEAVQIMTGPQPPMADTVVMLESRANLPESARILNALAW
jgi:molybdopterin biosynthesis enzyme